MTQRVVLIMPFFAVYRVFFVYLSFTHYNTDSVPVRGTVCSIAGIGSW